MPIYLIVDGVTGDSAGTYQSSGLGKTWGGNVLLTSTASIGAGGGGGVNVLMADGSVRFIRHSINLASGHKFTLERTYGGVSVAAGDLVGDGQSIGAIEVSRIHLPNSPLGFGAVDSRSAGVVGKAGMLCNAARGFGLSGGIVVSIPRGAASQAARRAQCSNNLKQLILAAHGRIPAAKFLVHDTGNPNCAAIELENVLITSYQVGTLDNNMHQWHNTGRIGGVAIDPSDPNADQYLLNFTKIMYRQQSS